MISTAEIAGDQGKRRKRAAKCRQKKEQMSAALVNANFQMSKPEEISRVGRPVDDAGNGRLAEKSKVCCKRRKEKSARPGAAG